MAGDSLPTIDPRMFIQDPTEMIGQAEQASRAQNPLLNLLPAIQGLQIGAEPTGLRTTGPATTLKQDNRQRMMQGLLAGVAGGLGQRMQLGQNQAIVDAATGASDGSDLPPSVFAPLSQGMQVFNSRSNMMLPFLKLQMDAALAMKRAELKNDRDKAFIEKALQPGFIDLHPEYGNKLMELLGVAGTSLDDESNKPLGPAKVSGQQPDATSGGSPFRTSDLVKSTFPTKKGMTIAEAKEKFGTNWDAIQKGMSDTAAKSVELDPEFGKSITAMQSKLPELKQTLDSVEQAIQGAGETGDYAVTGDKLRKTVAAIAPLAGYKPEDAVKQIWGQNDGTGVVGSRVSLNQLGLKMSQDVRAAQTDASGKAAGGSFAVRNMPEFNYFIENAFGEGQTPETNKKLLLAGRLAYGAQSAFAKYLQNAHSHGMTQEQALGAWNDAADKTPSTTGGLPNPTRIDGDAMFGKALFLKQPPAMQKQIASTWISQNGPLKSEADKAKFYSFIASQ